MTSVMDRLMNTMVSGAFILIAPAFLICTGIAFMAYRKRGSAPRD
ncbi:MAG TPA: hypothetical protein VNX15_01035 [Gemmatimonadales bacterium]|jgi:hypothetical protein|nr:hypothetical protein [Gemmatimonadales bacterium]